MRGRVAEIGEGPGNNPVTTQRMVKSEAFDMVILATACVPTKGTPALAGRLGITTDKFGFVSTSPFTPVDTSVPGIFTCGCAQTPMDVSESVAQSSSAAERAAEVVTQ